MSLANLGEGGFFSFVGDGEAGEISIRREFLTPAPGEEIVGKASKIRLKCQSDSGVVGLIGLDDDVGVVKVTTTNSTDNLIKQFKSAFFGGKIGQSEPRIGLDDADGGEQRKIEAARQGLSADQDLNLAGFDRLIEFAQGSIFIVITVKTADFGLWEEPGELGLEELGAIALVNNTGLTAGRTA